MRRTIIPLLFALNCWIAVYAGFVAANRDIIAAELLRVTARQVAVLEAETMMDRLAATERITLDTAYRRGLAENIVDAAIEHGEDHRLVTAVAWVESRMTRDAISGKDARGIMQIVPRWWVGVAPGIDNVNDLHDTAKNIRAGAWILAHYRQRCGGKLLRCYESGPRMLDTGYEAKVMRALAGERT